MRKINFDGVEASAEGSYRQLPPGAYACTILDVSDFEDRQYVQVLVDIIDGEYANYFSDRFYADKPWAHRMILSYRDTALGMLKGRLAAISECNPGFDAEAAWNGGNLGMFVGKAVGVAFRQEEYLDKKTGEFKLGSARPDRFCALDALDDPRNASPAPKMLKDDAKRRLSAEADVRASTGIDVGSVRPEDIDTPF